jgi:hypothetical protein
MLSTSGLDAAEEYMLLIINNGLDTKSVEPLLTVEKFGIQYTILLAWSPNFHDPAIHSTNAPAKSMIRSICKVPCNGIHSILILAIVYTTYINKPIIADPIQDDMMENGIRMCTSGPKNNAKI